MERLVKHVNLWIVILVAILICQSLVLAVSVNRLDDLWKQVNTPGREINFETAQQVHNAVLGIYRQPTVDAPTNRLYFPDLKIYLPYNEQSKQIVYDYQPTFDSIPAEVTLNSYTTVNTIPLSFNDIPCMQGMVDVGINKALDSNTQATIKLSDGRTMYVKTRPSKENLNHCNDMWGTFGPTQMIDLLKQAKSY